MTPRTINALALTVLFLAPHLVFGQGLGAAAKKEQARRKQAPTTGPAKVYTESDLPSSGAKETPADKDAAPNGAASGGTKSQAAPRVSAAAATQSAAVEGAAQIAAKKAQIAELESRVQQLAKLPTGGGKVCRIDKPIDFTGDIAPNQVVCPYQMESRYDEAKRKLQEAKAELGQLEQQARSSRR